MIILFTFLVSKTNKSLTLWFSIWVLLLKNIQFINLEHCELTKIVIKWKWNVYILFLNDLNNMPTTTFYNNIQNSGLPLIQTLSETHEVVYQVLW